MNTEDGKGSSSSRDRTGLKNGGALAGLLEIAFEAVVEFDSRERITSWNPAAEQMFGWTTQEALGKTPAKLFLPTSTPEEQKSRRQRRSRLKRGETLRAEQTLCRKHGSALQVQSAERAVFNADGEFTGSLAVYQEVSAQDITRRQQNEESLRARTEEIETLLQVSPIAIFVAHDPECTHITGNPAGYRLVKLSENANISKSAPSPERPTYRTFRNGMEVPADDLPMQKAARLGVEINEDALELRFEDGSRKFIFAFAKPLFDLQGRVRGAIAAMLDISDRLRIEEQLERNHQRLNDILASIEDDFYVLDRDWYFVYASKRFASRLGKQPEDFVGKNIWKLFPKHLGTIYEENVRAAMEKRQVRRFEILGRYTDAWYRMTAFPSPEGITILGTDITESKRAAQELDESRQIFETMVNHIPVAVTLIRGSDLRLQLVNPAYQALAPGKEMVGSTLDELWPETGQDLTAICRRVLETGEPHQVVDELNMIRQQSDGELEPRYFSWSMYRVQLPGNGGWGLLNTSWETTARKQVEEALRMSEQRLRQMIETSPVAIGFGNSLGKIFDANLSFYRLTGYSRAEILAGQIGWDQLTAPEYAEQDRQIMEALAAAGSAGPYEKEYIRKDGSRIPLLITVSRLPGRDEHIAFIMDMTERKRTEQALAEAMQELQAHIDNSPLAVIAFDREYRITEWSAGAERMFGWRADEILNKRIADLRWVYEEDVERVADLSADMFAGRTPSNMHTNRNYRKDGSVIVCEWYNSALLDANENLLSVRSQVLDVTERKQAEELILRQSELLQRIVENIPVLLVMWDPHLRKFTLNCHAETVLGWTSADINGGDFMSMVYPDPDYRAEVSTYMQSLAGGFRELINTAKDGEQIPIEWANIRLADDTMIGIGVDLREHKRAEAALLVNQKQLQLLNETLEQQVHEKTAEVRQLAAELIKAVQRERHRLSHILHDDLQQRVYAIRMQLTFLRDHLPPQNETAQKDVSEMETQLDEILMVTRNLSIDLSPPILRDEGLSQAINWLATRMRQRYGLSIELQANGTFALTDEELHVLLFNCVRELLFNVVKHAQATRAVVELQWVDDNLQIEVRDNGKGFVVDAPRAQRPEALAEEEEELQSSSGLSTLQHQLNLFGGRLEIQSAPGAGTRAVLIVPVAATGN